MNLYKAGEIDAVYNHTVPYAWVDEMRRLKDYMDKPENAIEYYMFNTKKAPMNDIRVRRAFNMAIDKAALAAYQPRRQAADGVHARRHLSGLPAAQGRSVRSAARPRAARRGRVPRCERSVRSVEVSGQPISRSATTPPKPTSRPPSSFRLNGSRISALTVPLQEYRVENVPRFAREAPIQAAPRGPDGSATTWIPYTFLDLFSTETGDNGTGWSDPKYVAMLREANTQPDPAKRYELLARAEAFLLARSRSSRSTRAQPTG